MRKGFAGHEAKVAAVLRRGSRRIASRALACLVGLLLVLQVAGVHHRTPGTTPGAAKAAALASLGAAIGQPAVLCEHGDDAPLPDRRDRSSDCEHCAFCHSVAVAPPFGDAISADRVAIYAGVARARDRAGVVRTRASRSATPRGPPALG